RLALKPSASFLKGKGKRQGQKTRAKDKGKRQGVTAVCDAKEVELPSKLPPWQTVFYLFRRFRLSGTWHLLTPPCIAQHTNVWVATLTRARRSWIAKVGGPSRSPPTSAGMTRTNA